MDTKQIKLIILTASLVAFVVLIGYFGYKAVMPPTPPAGSYTPGVPPWMDKDHKNTVPTGVHATP